MMKELEITKDGRRGLKVFFYSLLASLLSMAFLAMLPNELRPALGLMFVLGFLYGPYASLGCAVSNAIWHFGMGLDMLTVGIDFASAFLVSYIPYRLWYSTMEDVRPKVPILGTSQNMAKILVIMIVSTVIYASLDHVLYVMMNGTEYAWVRSLFILLSIFPSAIVLTMLAIFITGTLKMHHWTPPIKMERDMWDHIDSRVYILALVLVIPLSIITSFSRSMAVFGSIACFLLIALFCMKPQMSVRQRDLPVYRADQRFNRFDEMVNDRIIILFNFLGLGAILIMAALFDAGLLGDIPFLVDLAAANAGFGNMTTEALAGDLSLYTYLSLACIVLFIVVLLFLRFIERTVVTPMEDMSNATRDFVVSEAVMSREDMHERCKPYLLRRDEVGDLARSIETMAKDVAEYIKDIDSLTRDKQAYRAELAIARQIQMGLVPKDFDVVDGMGVRIAGMMEAAKFVGGDLYDFLVLDDKVAVSIGDVSGKGVPAALFMSRAKALMEDHTGRGSEPAEVFTEVNNALAHENTQMLFVTSWLGIIDTLSGKVTFANAGHCPPLIWRAETQHAEYIEMEPRPILGIMPDVEYLNEHIEMAPGDRLMIYTDGVTEANSDYDEFYGCDRLREIFEETSVNTINDQIRIIREDIKSFVKNAEQFDDITMLTLEYIGREPVVKSTGLRFVD